jgi:hypothetical protein
VNGLEAAKKAIVAIISMWSYASMTAAGDENSTGAAAYEAQRRP